MVIEFPVNLGHGVALQVAYRYCVTNNVKYVVTLDADGQNDPSEIPQILAPLVADTSDFVLGSRVLGVDKTSDKVRKLGVRFFSFIMNRMTGSHHHRHLDGVPRATRDDAGRRRGPSASAAVSDLRVAHHLPETRVARE